MFWVLLFCHLVADYPLQTNAMVKAKKTFTGLLVHITVHFLTMLFVLAAVLKLPLINALFLSAAISFLHLLIDNWKKIFTRLKPEWVVFIYIQDQFLHLSSILLVFFLWQQAGYNFEADINTSVFIYGSGFILVSFSWFVSEYIFSYQNPDKQKWIIETMWSRIMFRLIIYSQVIIGMNIWFIVLLAGAISMIWFDLDKSNRYKTIALDTFGVSALILASFWIIA